jgi:para-nitrobenzyl esterase
VQGEIDGGTRRFLGIPFAAPPVGELRWRPPAPPIPWEGVREAKQFGGRCAQTGSILTLPSEEEDCLYLNVWTPEPAPARRLPVMVWFHYGGNQTGWAGDPFPGYNGRVLAETRNVIVVTINDRLGVFGFFAHSSLAAEDPAYPYAGNQGLLDQRAALEWVRRNITAFGGDPNNVTIFGQSGGGFDVSLHVVSHGGRGLFHRAIAESPVALTGHGRRIVPAGGPGAGVIGACTNRLRTAAEAESNAAQLIAAVGCAVADDTLACLRQVPVADLLRAAGTDFVPIVDGNVLPDQPRALFNSGNFAKVPYILGATADEGTFFFLGVPPVTTQDEYLTALRELYGDLADEVAAIYPPEGFASPQDALARAYGDSALVCSTEDNARRAAASSADVWIYNFARPTLLGRAAHGGEIAYVFGSVLFLPTAIDEAIALAMQGYWTRFARTGDPNGEGALLWPRYDDASDQHLNFDAETTVITGFRRSECEFWWSVYDREFE